MMVMEVPSYNTILYGLTLNMCLALNFMEIHIELNSSMSLKLFCDHGISYLI